ncbi:molybdopterin-binding protein [Thioflexithrix psekupsensis]|uniref:Molybdopterin molybdenumtransferase n=1 Tax=Thioflexithrix psekupsensis TaxID=1570016 RepID=A0A251XAI7_9GAMM|nr:molybdopterin-binding protein [Thioflexithrix psekupsensis]OUD15442.1 hypothetical protein TPSD3_02635 [Thioflexithrix psekupsensis]
MIRHMVELTAVWAWLDQYYTALPAESLPIAQAQGRILASPLYTPYDIPINNCAAINGYALQGQDTFGASDYQPLLFMLHHDQFYSTSLPITYPIVTGQAMFNHTDAVLPLDYAELQAQQLWVHQAVAPYHGVLRAGGDFTTGEVLLPAGRILQAVDLAIIQALGEQKIAVIATPKIRLVILGAPSPAQDMNAIWLFAHVKRDGGQVVEICYPSDNKKELAAILTKTDVDLVITTGQIGWGSNDGFIDWFAEQGQVIAAGIAARPCPRAGLGVFGQVPVVFLPGHPAPAIAAYDLLAARAIRRAAGLTTMLPYALRKMPAAKKLVSTIGFFDYCRVKFVEQGVIALGMDNRLHHCLHAEGVVLIPAHLEGYAAGTEVSVYCYRDMNN